MREASFVLSFACLNVAAIVAFFVLNYKMLVRWYRENPTKTNSCQIRTIRVGLNPAEGPEEPDHLSHVSLGVIVPEADRQERPQSLML